MATPVQGLVGGTMTTGAFQLPQGIVGGVPVHPAFPADGGMQQHYRQDLPLRLLAEHGRHMAEHGRYMAEHGRHINDVSMAWLQMPSGQTVCHPVQDRAVLTDYQRHLQSSRKGQPRERPLQAVHFPLYLLPAEMNMRREIRMAALDARAYCAQYDCAESQFPHGHLIALPITTCKLLTRAQKERRFPDYRALLEKDKRHIGDAPDRHAGN